MKPKKPLELISSAEFGVSFSLKQCSAFGLNPKEALSWLLEVGFRRFRLMSYWDEHEKEEGKLDFSQLDWQIEMISDAGGVISLSLGARQPRWPENHWPEWAWQATKPERTESLYSYITAVVERYKDNLTIISWQLENEALLKSFGRNAEVDRHRLRKEYSLIKELDPSRQIIMSTSNGWGIPLRWPVPDIVGFSYYPIMYMRGKYTHTVQRPWLHRLRKRLIKLIWHRPVFIHELQLEPWGHTAIWKMSVEDQSKSMSAEQIKKNVVLAREVDAYPIDLWGAEWWYWRLKKHNDSSIWHAVKNSIK